MFPGSALIVRFSSQKGLNSEIRGGESDGASMDMPRELAEKPSKPGAGEEPRPPFLSSEQQEEPPNAGV